MVHGEVSEYLAVQPYTSGAEAVHEAAVGGTVLPGGGIDTGDPQAAEDTLFVAAVAVGILHTLFDGILGNGIDLGAGTEIALGGLHNPLTAGAAGNRIN